MSGTYYLKLHITSSYLEEEEQEKNGYYELNHMNFPSIVKSKKW